MKMFRQSNCFLYIAFRCCELNFKIDAFVLGGLVEPVMCNTF